MSVVVNSPHGSVQVGSVSWLLAGSLTAIGILNLGPFLGIPDDLNAIATMLIGLALTLVHGQAYLGWKRLSVFLALTVVVSFSAEALGVATGLIFGPYHYTDHLGPKLLGVPLLIQAAYVAMGYASLVTARIVLGAHATPRGWRSLLLLALLTSLIMVAWDVAMDPYQSTMSGDWIWETGGAYFGVPLHNYAGWFATVATFTLLYLAFERRHPKEETTACSPFFLSAPVLYYALVGIGIFVTPLVEPIETLAAPANYSGPIPAMTGSLSLIAVFVMGTPACIALSRLFDDDVESTRR